MNRQTIMLIAMVVVLGVFFRDTIMQLFSKGSAALPSLSKPSAPKRIDDSAIRALLAEAGADSLVFGTDQWSSDIFQDRTKLFESWFRGGNVSRDLRFRLSITMPCSFAKSCILVAASS